MGGNPRKRLRYRWIVASNAAARSIRPVFD